MNRLVLASAILICCFLTVASYGQSGKGLSKEEKKAQKEARKQEKVAQENAFWASINSLAVAGNFVVEINQVGTSGQLSPNLNFLYVHQDSIVIQLTTWAPASTNGLGGITIDGWVTNYRYNPPKKQNKPMFIEFDVQSKNRAGVMSVSLTVFYDGKTDISLTGAGNYYHGNFMSPSDSKVLIGADMRN